MDFHTFNSLNHHSFSMCLARRYDEAIEVFDRALAIDPDDEVVHYHRNAVIQRRDLQEMVFRWVVIGTVVFVGYVVSGVEAAL